MSMPDPGQASETPGGASTTPGMGDTQPLLCEGNAPNPEDPEATRALKTDPGQTKPPLSPSAPTASKKIPLILGGVVLLAAGLLVMRLRSHPAPCPTPLSTPATSPSPDASYAQAPPALRPYLLKANGTPPDPAAMEMLATCYLQGLNVPKDQAKAIFWYKKAAQAGRKNAQRWLDDNKIPRD